MEKRKYILIVDDEILGAVGLASVRPSRKGARPVADRLSFLVLCMTPGFCARAFACPHFLTGTRSRWRTHQLA